MQLTVYMKLERVRDFENFIKVLFTPQIVFGLLWTSW